jgi:alkanesulfonate monooxygenase SsuD/methylene tetrahydromethanopterin reductase-like flavin-dependent oxidoreductase (luciferase family)
MEFGILLQGPVLGEKFKDPKAEYEALHLDVDIIKQADKSGFKYAWVAEHHGLTQYSHLSASEVVIPFALAQTERIHVGSGIWPLNPVTNHPVRLAERAAMADLLSNGRFEFGTGRGAGSWEVGTFDVDPSETKATWDAVIREFVKMWQSKDPRMEDAPGYSHDGPLFTVPPRRINPKPFGGPNTHPPMWCAVGNIPTFQKCAANGLGALGFGFLFSDLEEVKPAVDAYKTTIDSAEPVGLYSNDNFMIAALGLCLDDAQEAREAMKVAGMNKLLSLVYLYHDTMPRPDWAVIWPDVEPEPTAEQVDEMITNKAIICGDPGEVIEQVREYEAVGVDQLALGVPVDMPRDIALESIRVFGEKVIPHFDRDPIHRSARHRFGASAEAVLADPGSVVAGFDSRTAGATASA